MEQQVQRSHSRRVSYPAEDVPDSGHALIEDERREDLGESAPATKNDVEAAWTEDQDFTARAVLIGLTVGALLAFTNLYFGLQTGWISMMSLQSGLLGFAISKSLPRAWPLFGGRGLSPQENVVLQTTAVATGTMPLSAGLVGIIPALQQLNLEEDGSLPIHLSVPQLLGWCFAVAFFGVFFAVPLRVPMIVKEKLIFPSATATAQLIAVLHRAKLFRDPTSGDGTRSAGAFASSRRPKTSNATRRRRIASRHEPVGPDGYAYHSLASEDDDENAATDRFLTVEETQTLRAEEEVADVPEDSEAVIAEDGSGWRMLAWSFTLSAALTILSFLFPVLYAIPVFDLVYPTLSTTWGWWLTPSLSYVGQGIIMGLPTTASMTIGMTVGWAVLSPLADKSGWTTGPVMDGTHGSRGWILWIALAIMVAESVISLLVLIITTWAPTIRALLSPSFRSPKQARSRSFGRDPLQVESEETSHGVFEDDGGLSHADIYDDDEEEEEEGEEDEEPSHRLIPMSWVVVGLLLSTVTGTFLIRIVFGNEGIRPWATLLAIVLSGFLSVLGVRALGETDINPVSGIGKISQLIFALAQPGNVVANVISGGIAEAGAQQAGDLAADYKTGHLLGASPRSQFYGQMIGSVFSIFVSTLAYTLYTRAYDIPGLAFPAPTAAVWLNLARLVNKGRLPDKSAEFMLAFAVVFGVFAAVKTAGKAHTSRFERRERGEIGAWARLAVAVSKFSGVAFAVGILNTPNFSIARLAGGILAHVYSRRHVAGGGRTPLFLIILASGFVLGEGFASILSLLLNTLGFRSLTCAGCRGGCTGVCSS